MIGLLLSRPTRHAVRTGPHVELGPRACKPRRALHTARTVSFFVFFHVIAAALALARGCAHSSARFHAARPPPPSTTISTQPASI
ncbi:hypothetical protein M422DRAFT_255629 [Sphaerobolus stellatus SS14]|uniref:Uncharacterized protein n=1 Tax=Sphaerobolus stellatus (strain SS14) TaxID=990650 RepID=A0A0C9V3D3_SPHS4|nr:hypothetical protein M422DRAFT_255629 [Sphaerobolus stellatus SS14]